MDGQNTDDQYFQAALLRRTSRSVCPPERQPLIKPIPNPEATCLVIAMRQLLKDPHWGPDWVLQEIAIYGGFSHRRLEEIPGIQVLMENWMCVALDDGPAMVSAQNGRRISLEWTEHIIALTYNDALGESHAECMSVRDLWQLREILGIIRHQN